MGHYIALLNWTEAGVKAVKDSPARLDAARALGKKLGVEIKSFYMTTGDCDMVIIAEAQDDDAMARFNLTVAMGGHIRTRTLKAFSEDNYRKILASL
jgi:uncharacterized protein with GYD domain